MSGRRILRSEILRAVSRVAMVSIKEMSGPGRRKSLARARRAFYYLCRVHTKSSFRTIAKTIGRTDHTTTLKTIRRARAQFDTIEEICRAVEVSLGICILHRNIAPVHFYDLGNRPYTDSGRIEA